jgi:hypothetical protein
MTLALNSNVQHAIRQSNLVATPSSNWVPSFAAHATPHSKGNWATLLTTTYDAYGFWLTPSGTSAAATQTDMLVDVAIGPSQENIIIPEWLCGWRPQTNVAPISTYFPIFIPKGTLISARIQALITVDTLFLGIFTNEGASAFPSPLFSGCDAYGTNIAASQGTSHTPGDSGAESTAADIGVTTTRPYSAVMLGLGGTLANTTMNGLQYHWELVIGGTTVCEWWAATTTGEQQLGPVPTGPFLVSIPTGTQLQVRAECSGTAQAQDVAFYCFY